MSKPIYTAIFLSDDSAAALKKLYPPRHPNVHAHHVTLIFKPSPENLVLLEPYLEKEVKCEVVGEAFDQRGQAAKVTVPEHLHLNGQVHHVTISCAEGVTPVYSNELLKRGWERGPEVVPPVVLEGVIRHFTR